MNEKLCIATNSLLIPLHSIRMALLTKVMQNTYISEEDHQDQYNIL